MPLTFQDALASQRGADPLGSFLKGYQSGLAGAQARDTSMRDNQRIALQAVAQAKAAKAQDFNEMLSQMKLAQDDRQFGQSMAQRQQELGLRQQQQSFQQNLLSQGVNPRTGVAYSTDSFLPTQYLGASSNGAATPQDGSPVGLPTGPEGSVAPDAAEGGPGSDLFPTSDTATSTDTITTPAGANADANVITDIPSSPDNSGPTLLDTPAPSQAKSGPSGSIGSVLEQLKKQYPTAYANATPATFSEAADRVLSSQKATQELLASKVQSSAAKAQEAARYAMDAGSMVRNTKLPADVRQQWMESQSNAARVAGEEKQKAVEAAKTAAEEGVKTKLLESRANSLSSINNLSTVLPVQDYLKLTKAALTPIPDPQVTAALDDLQIYNNVRQANGWDYPSKSIITARKVAQAYSALNDPDVVKSRQAEEEARLVETEVNRLTQIAGNKTDSATFKRNEAALTAAQKQFASLNTTGLLYRARQAEYDAAKEADMASTTKAVENGSKATSVKSAGADPRDKYFGL